MLFFFGRLTAIGKNAQTKKTNTKKQEPYFPVACPRARDDTPARARENALSSLSSMKSDELLRPVSDSKLGSVNCVRFTSDGNYCVTAGDDKTVRLYNPHKSSLSKDRFQKR